MQSSKLRIRVLCTAVLTSCAGVACDQALAPQYQHPSGSAGGSDGNPGSGGSGPTVSTGSGGAVGGGNTAGSSGAVGIAGSAGAGGAPIVDACAHAGPRTKTDLTPTNGRVECTTNDFGIEGDWKLNSSDPDLMSVSFAGSTVCGKGKIQVVSQTTGDALGSCVVTLVALRDLRRAPEYRAWYAA